MCAVLVREQFVCETTRSRWVTVGMWLLLLSLCLAKVYGEVTPPAVPTIWPETMLDECYDEYLLDGDSAKQVFTNDCKECEFTANQTTIDLSIDVDLERAQIEEGRDTLCGNFERCREIVDDLQYFACTKDSGSYNLQLITEINRNATSAQTRLRTELGEVQQRLILCTLEAQKTYMNSMREAHVEWELCRAELDKYNEQNTTPKAQN